MTKPAADAFFAVFGMKRVPRYTTEIALQRAIVSSLRKAGIWVIRTQSSGSYKRRSVSTGEPGMPDLYLPGRGHLEVKLPGEELSKPQREWHAKATRSRVNVATVSSVNDALVAVTKWKVEAR